MSNKKLDEQILAMSDIPLFVRQNTDWMLAVAFRIIQDHGLSEDAVQTAFTKIFTKIHSFEVRSSLKSWMHRSVINEALMALRSRKRANERSIDALLPSFDSEGVRIEQKLLETKTPESLLEKDQTNSYVRMAIMQLPDDYRIVLCLRDIEGLSTAETIEALGISEANVKIRLHRARAALKKLLEPMVKDHKI